MDKSIDIEKTRKNLKVIEKVKKVKAALGIVALTAFVGAASLTVPNISKPVSISESGKPAATILLNKGYKHIENKKMLTYRLVEQNKNHISLLPFVYSTKMNKELWGGQKVKQNNFVLMYAPKTIPVHEIIAKYGKYSKNVNVEIASGVIEKFWEEVKPIAKEYNLPPELICGIIMIESAGKNYEKSDVGAAGLMQINPIHFEKYNLNWENVFNPKMNIGAGTAILNEAVTKLIGNDGKNSIIKYFSNLLEGVQPDPKLQDMVSLVIASYNRGISGVIEDVNHKGASAFEKADYVNAVNGATLLIYKLRLQEKSQIVEIAKNKEIDRASINIG